MAVLPLSPAGKILAYIWIAACVSVPIYAFVNRDIESTDIVVVSAMLILTFPSGIVFVGLVSLILMALDSLLGVTPPGGFIFNFVIWVPMAELGYAQWFHWLPAAFRRT